MDSKMTMDFLFLISMQDAFYKTKYKEFKIALAIPMKHKLLLTSPKKIKTPAAIAKKHLYPILLNNALLLIATAILILK